MKKNYLWTELRARIELVKTNPGSRLNWLFLAGGPGLGSESLEPLTKNLCCPGNLWHLDLPGDGSNLTENNKEAFSHWREALIEAVHCLDSVILVGHSTGGMYILSTPELEKSLQGLVLMDSAPSAEWQKPFMDYMAKNPIPNFNELHELYQKKPNNEVLRELTLLSLPYLKTKMSQDKAFSFLENLPYNFESCDWSALHFDTTYEAKWFPNSLPTLIFSGDQDKITPLKLFDKPEFKKNNIMIESIPNAGHFPWIENPKAAGALFSTYYQRFFAQNPL